MSGVTIDIEKSIIRGKLIVQEGWMAKFDKFLIYFSMAFLALIGPLAILELDFGNPNEEFLGLVVFPFLSIFGLYVFYCKAREKYFFKLSTPFNRQKNRQILMEYAKKHRLGNRVDSDECLVFSMDISGYYYTNIVLLVVILKDNLIQYTTVTKYERSNFPTLFYHWIVKYRLTKMLKKLSRNEGL